MNLFHRKKYVNGIIALILSFLFLSCSSENKLPDAATEAGTAVTVINPVKANLTQYLNLNATTIFLNKETVRATFQGFIEKINKNIGDNVEVGDTLFLIKTRESYASDSLSVLIGDDLFKGGIAITSQVKGILTELDYHNGDYVNDGEQLAIISKPSSLFLNLNVPYQYTERIKVNSECEIILPDGNKLTATVTKIIPSVDLNSQTQRYLLKLNKQANVPENLNVNAKIPINIVKDVLAVKRSAVLANETMTKFWLMKLIDDTTAVKVNIQKGIETDSLVQIVKPNFDMNTRIVDIGAYGLADTAKVAIVK